MSSEKGVLMKFTGTSLILLIELHRRESVVECYATTELVRVSAESSGSDPDTTPLTAQGSASEGYTPTTSETASVDFS